MYGPPDLFIGLVTHPHSVYNAGGLSTKNLESLVQQLEAGGLNIQYLVSDRNDYSSELFPVTLQALRSAAAAQSQLERNWRLFVIERAHYSLPVRWTKLFKTYASYWAMLVKRMVAASKGVESSAAQAYRRLLNIDLSHARVLSHGLSSGASTILILEDDASVLNKDQINDLVRLIEMAQTKAVEFVNLSESISAQDLGVSRILNRGKVRESLSTFELIELDTPVTNTVCANLYSIEFASRFLRYLTPDRLTPVNPIDWRLNEYMMEHPRTSCWWARPGPFVQRSMHG